MCSLPSSCACVEKQDGRKEQQGRKKEKRVLRLPFIRADTIQTIRIMCAHNSTNMNNTLLPQLLQSLLPLPMAV